MTLPAPPLLVVGAASALLAILAGVGAVRAYQRRRVMAGSGWFLVGVILAMVSGAAAMLAIGTAAYRNLTQETRAATVTLTELGPQEFVATLERPDEEPVIAELHGDAFVVEARILKWHGAAAALGLRTGYVLARLASRYDDIDQERAAPRTVVALDEGRRVDAFDVLVRWPQLAPWVDATYGSGTYAPMRDGARYDVRVSTTGLLLRPLAE